MNGAPSLALARCDTEWQSGIGPLPPRFFLPSSGRCAWIDQPRSATALGTSTSTLCVRPGVDDGQVDAGTRPAVADVEAVRGRRDRRRRTTPACTVIFGTGFSHAASSSTGAAPLPSAHGERSGTASFGRLRTGRPGVRTGGALRRPLRTRAAAGLSTATAAVITPATHEPDGPAVVPWLGRSTPIAAPNTQASCRNVSERANALERSVSPTSRWIIESRAILASAFATARTNMPTTASSDAEDDRDEHAERGRDRAPTMTTIALGLGASSAGCRWRCRGSCPTPAAPTPARARARRRSRAGSPRCRRPGRSSASPDSSRSADSPCSATITCGSKPRAGPTPAAGWSGGHLAPA